jgi:hypothetical protein
MPLLLRGAQGHRSGDWNPDDFDVLDDWREVGRIYGITAATEVWSWGASFQLAGACAGSKTAVDLRGGVACPALCYR